MCGLFVLMSMPASAQEIPGWTLVWSDEFDGPEIDTSKWSHEVNGDGGGNNELQYYTARSQNSFIEDGNLVIQALKENYSGKAYTSARLRTLNKGDWTYGRFEARMKLPYGQGLWPAFWMLPTDWVYGGWAASGEIDIMENVGHQPNVLHGTIHYHGEWPNNWSSGGSYTLPSGDFSDDFHVFALEWEEGILRWYVDDILYSTKTWWDTTSGAPFPAPFDERFHILLNVAVGGNWPGSPDGSTVFPQRMTVDYVRVYTASSTPPPTVSGELLNPGFETGSLAPWIGYSAEGANGAGGYVESTNATYYNGGNPGGDHILTHSGQYATKVYGDFTGGENYNGFYQDVAAVSGSVWSATGWALTHPQDLMLGENTTWIEVSFRDAGDTILSLYRSPIRTSANVTPGAWMNLEVTQQLNPATGAVMGSVETMTAPAGTTRIRYQVTFRQTNYDNGAMYFDDLSLVQQILPTSLSSSIEGGNIQIRFPTQNGVSYQMTFKNSLTNATWIPIETILGDGNTNTVSYAVTNPVSFYRVSAP